MMKSCIKIFFLIFVTFVFGVKAFAVQGGYYNPVTNTRVMNSSSGPVTTYYVSSPTAKYTRNNGIVLPQYVPNRVVPGGNNVIYRVSGQGSTVYYPNTGYYRNTYYPAQTTTTVRYTNPSVYYVPNTTTTTKIIGNGVSGNIINQYSGYSTPTTGINLLNNNGVTNVSRFLSW